MEAMIGHILALIATYFRYHAPPSTRQRTMQSYDSEEDAVR